MPLPEVRAREVRLWLAGDAIEADAVRMPVPSRGPIKIFPASARACARPRHLVHQVELCEPVLPYAGEMIGGSFPGLDDALTICGIKMPVR
jgi:hypothetical protein